MNVDHSGLLWLLTTLSLLVALGISLAVEAVSISPVLVIVGGAWLVYPLFVRLARGNSTRAGFWARGEFDPNTIATPDRVDDRAESRF